MFPGAWDVALLALLGRGSRHEFAEPESTPFKQEADGGLRPVRLPRPFRRTEPCPRVEPYHDLPPRHAMQLPGLAQSAAGDLILPEVIPTTKSCVGF